MGPRLKVLDRLPMVSRMGKVRTRDPATGKIKWVSDGEETATPETATAPARVVKTRKREERAPAAPRAKRSEWDRLFDKAQDSADAES